jgi:hypothetical protein
LTAPSSRRRETCMNWNRLALRVRFNAPHEHLRPPRRHSRLHRLRVPGCPSRWFRRVCVAGCFGLEKDAKPFVKSLEPVWTEPGYHAFTDLIRFQGQLHCSFREGTGHVPGGAGANGRIRIGASRGIQHTGQHGGESLPRRLGWKDRLALVERRENRGGCFCAPRPPAPCAISRGEKTPMSVPLITMESRCSAGTISPSL